MNAPGAAAKTVDFARATPPRLFFALLHQRFTGVLQLRQTGPNEGERAVWFCGGMPVFTDWAENTDVLGQVLLEHHLVGEAPLVAALGSMANGGAGRLGEILLAAGEISHEQLAQGLRQQCVRKLVHLFGLSCGQGTLTSCEHNLSAMAKINVLELILTAVGRHYSVDRIRYEMGAGLDGPLRTTSAYVRYHAHFSFRPTDTPVLEALGSGSTLLQLDKLCPGNDQRAAQLVYVLWACQMLRVGLAATTQESPRATPRATPKAAVAPAAVAPAPVTPAPVAVTPAPVAPVTPAPAVAQAPSARTAVATSGSRPPDQDEAAFLVEVVRLEQAVEAKANPFALLGVETSAGKRDIRRAWSDLSRVFHPDALQAKGWGHLQKRVSDVFAALSEANTELADKTKREQLREAIERGDDLSATNDATALARAAFESELVAREGDRMLKANRFDLALQKYDQALLLTPEEPDLIAAAAWCSYGCSAKTREDGVRCERALSDTLEEAPNLARAHFFRGLVLKDLKATDPAISAFRRAFSLDPHLIDAQRQIRALQMQSQDKRGRGLKGLFGKR